MLKVACENVDAPLFAVWFGSVHVPMKTLLAYDNNGDDEEEDVFRDTKEQDAIINWEDYNEIIVFNFIWVAEVVRLKARYS